MAADLIRISDATLGYGRQKVLQGVNFAIRQGDFLGVMGPNGSGKTTILKSLLGLLKPISGKIETFGADASSHLFGYVPQRESLDSHFPLTALEVALMGRFGRIGTLRRPKAEDFKIARACLKQTYMDAFEDRLYRELSGGQKQRVLISRALASEPKVLLLDEPTNGMDMNAESAIMELLTELQRQKQTTIVFVTHLLSTVECYAHQVALITSKGNLLIGEKSRMLSPDVLADAYQLS